MADAVPVDTVAACGAVLLLAVVTMVTRVGGVWMMSYVRITPRVETFLKYMSISVLISIVVPAAWAGGTAHLARRGRSRGGHGRDPQRRGRHAGRHGARGRRESLRTLKRHCSP
jgi:Branched-chain amino acid transport protein (AzlD)